MKKKAQRIGEDATKSARIAYSQLISARNQLINSSEFYLLPNQFHVVTAESDFPTPVWSRARPITIGIGRFISESSDSPIYAINHYSQKKYKYDKVGYGHFWQVIRYFIAHFTKIISFHLWIIALYISIYSWISEIYMYSEEMCICKCVLVWTWYSRTPLN